MRPQEEELQGVAPSLDGVGRVVAHGEGFEVVGGFMGGPAGSSSARLPPRLSWARCRRCLPRWWPLLRFMGWRFGAPDVRSGRSGEVPGKASAIGLAASRGRSGEGARSAPPTPRSWRRSLISRPACRHPSHPKTGLIPCHSLLTPFIYTLGTKNPTNIGVTETKTATRNAK